MLNLENLKELRMKKGYSQAKIAKECGVSLNAYIKWEQGVSKPIEENYTKLEELLS